MPHLKIPQYRIKLVAGTILIVVTLLASVTVFVVMQRHAEVLLSNSLQSSLQNRVQLTQTEIGTAFDKAVSISTRPLLIDQLQHVNARADDTAARNKLTIAALSFIQRGLTATVLYGKDGQELARAGVFAQRPELAVPLKNFPGQVQLMWDGQLLLRAVVEIKKDGRVVGKVMTESPLPATMGAIKEAARLGKTVEQVICVPAGLNLQQCFPTTLTHKAFTAPLRTPEGVRLPMTHAFELSEPGFTVATDYRHKKVAAAYSKIGDTGLGMVLKMDRDELHAPVWDQLRYLIPLLAGVLIIALLLLRWRLTPLLLSLVRSEAEAAQRNIALTKENTERKRAEAELLQFKNVLDNTLDMIFMFEPESLRFVYVNQGAVLSMGYSREELLEMTPCQIKPLITESEFRQIIAPLLSREQPSLRFDTLHRRKNGTDFSVAIFLQLVTQIDGSNLFIATMHDITEKKESEQVIWQQANFDTLTDLPNRRMFYDRLGQEIKKSHRSGLPMALMLLDLDRFKEVNDTLGHAQGDVLLIEAARRIGECVRESDTVARLGGDEFTVILSEIEDTNSVERIAQNIIERLAAPFQLLQETADVSVSAGITLYPDDAQNIEALMKNADQAMYLAKKSGGNRFSYFTVALQEAAQTRLRLISDLRGALVGQQFQVFYQPIVTLANGAIHKAEALLRWQHPTRGFISPAEFIPVAEETGMIIDIGDWVFREVARTAAHWRASHHPEFQISVNVSPVQFRHNGTDFKAWLDYLQKLGLPGQNIVLEITEGLLLDAHTSITDQLLAFRDAGIRVSLDDFGTGYSSLSYLKKFDIDYIKIDQSFVRNMAEDANDRILCEAIIVMAHKLGLKVIAEGVETEQQRDLLAAYGCDYAQGWLYSKAVPPEQFEILLRAQGK